MTPLEPEKLYLIEPLRLLKGEHESREAGMCVMEAVAYVAGEPHSDSPQCACPVITAFLVNWNDSLPTDDDRDRLLKPLIPLLVGTRSTKAIEKRRSYMALDWLGRTQAPAWLVLTPALRDHAQRIKALPAIVDAKTAKAAQPTWDAAGAAAWAAARAVAWTAARDAAWTAARAAAWEKLAPTVVELQASAQDLVRAMCEVA